VPVGGMPFAFPVEVPLLSTMVANSRCRPQSGGGSNEVMSLIFLSASNVPVIVYRHG
jgi:hypothetical protein